MQAAIVSLSSIASVLSSVRRLVGNIGIESARGKTKGTAPTFAAAADPVTNRLVGQGYDSNGNVTSVTYPNTYADGETVCGERDTP